MCPLSCRIESAPQRRSRLRRAQAILAALFSAWLASPLSPDLLAADTPPSIVEQPRKALVFEGAGHTFGVTASGSPPFSYQWSLNGKPLAEKTNSVLALSNVRSNDAGSYRVVVANAAASVTSEEAVLIVHGIDEPLYAPPDGGWAYAYNGEGVSISDAAALDGTWNHDNGSDAWAGDGRGPGNGLLGGVGSARGILTIEDAVVSGATSTDNRRFYFTHSFLQDSATTNASKLLDDGVTLHFRARLTPPAPLDPLTELTNAPNGWVNSSDGKGMLGIRQAGGGGMIISFSLNTAAEDLNPVSKFSFAQAGLQMNSLNGDLRSPAVDPGEGGTLNLLPLDPAAFHEFWITIQDNGSAPGTHRITIYRDGSFQPALFNVTAGTGVDGPSTSYLALGLGVTLQRGAFDLDYLEYRAGVLVPMPIDIPADIALQPVTQRVAPGQIASFKVGAAGTPPFSYQWFRNGVAIDQATNASYSTPPVAAGDNGTAFTVVVGNILNLASSSPPAFVRVILPPQVLSQPRSLIVVNGDPARFDVSVQAEGSVLFQWRHNDLPLVNETNSSLVLSSARSADAGRYDVIVTSPGGTVMSGVAALAVTLLDFGDAPDPSYPTLRASDGARHRLTNGLFLGAGVDADLDGQPNDSATGDDLNGAGDEDGITFRGPLLLGQPVELYAVSSSNAFLNAWVDFQGDGRWSEPGDQVFTNEYLVRGTNLLSFFLPASAKAGLTFARFRVNTRGNLTPSGEALDGEVEDYRISINLAADLALNVRGLPESAPVGSNLTYRIVVTNQGPSTASHVRLSEVLPLGFDFVSASTPAGSCENAGGTITCLLGDLGVGGSAEATIIALPLEAGSRTHEIRASASEADPVPENNGALVTTVLLQVPFK